MKVKQILLAMIIATALLPSCTQNTDTKEETTEYQHHKFVPDEHSFLMRSYPDRVFPINAYTEAIEAVHQDYISKKSKRSFGLRWTTEGPNNIGGRFNTMAINPSDSNIIYAGSAAGGVFKSINGGTTWDPIFDDQPYLAIGDIEIDPNNPNTIYVGTGDPNVSGNPIYW